MHSTGRCIFPCDFEHMQYVWFCVSALLRLNAGAGRGAAEDPVRRPADSAETVRARVDLVEAPPAMRLTLVTALMWDGVDLRKDPLTA